jgi:hypothetical protein
MTISTTSGKDPSDFEGGALLDRAIRLFKFMSRVQEIKAKTPRTIATYEREGDVVWFDRLPAHPAIVTTHRSGGADPDAPLLVVERVPRLPPPVPPELVQQWLATAIDDPATTPVLMTQIPKERSQSGADLSLSSTEQLEEETVVVLSLDDHPEVVEAFDSWMTSWAEWRSNELILKPVRDVYGRLFSIHLTASGNSEELEVVCGMGCLAWKPDDHDEVCRHTFTTPALVEFDDGTGRLTVRRGESTDILSLELDMLDPALVRDPQRVNDIRESASNFESHALDPDSISQLGRRLVHTLDPDGRYTDDDQIPTPGPDPTMGFAPALILRKRSQMGLVQIFEAIIRQLQASGEVPQGVLPLVDPNHVPDPGVEWDEKDGAMLTVDDEIFLPLPVNESQLRIVQKVNKSAQILVQGPPGTGKTHTAAALISHLLAKGKRVLVTAQTDRALKEVRNKLPDAIKPLSVAVVGAGLEDMSDLKVAVEGIAAAASERDDVAALAGILRYLEHVDALRQQRARLNHLLLEAREVEVREYERPDSSGTLAAFAFEHERLSERFSWIRNLVDASSDESAPISNLEMAEWRSYLSNVQLKADEADALLFLPDILAFPRPEDFGDLVRDESAAETVISQFPDGAVSGLGSLSSLSMQDREVLWSLIQWIDDEGRALEKRPEHWIAIALSDVRAGNGSPWRARKEQVAHLVSQISPLVGYLGPVQRIKCEGPFEPLIPIAHALRAEFGKGTRMKTDAYGRPKLGPLSNRVFKDASAFFSSVLVDGFVPTSIPALDIFLTWCDTERLLGAIDMAWPESTEILQEDTASERLHWHVAALAHLERVDGISVALDQLETTLGSVGIRSFNRNDQTDISSLLQALEILSATEDLHAAQKPLVELEELVRTVTRERLASSCAHTLEKAIRTRSVYSYGTAWDRVQYLRGLRDMATRRDEIGRRLESVAPALAASIQNDPENELLDEQLPSFVEAWNWRAIGSWIVDRDTVDVNTLRSQLIKFDDEIRRLVGEVAALRAWMHAVSGDRITGEARANLQMYVTLMRQLGKGTGKYASQRRADIRRAMDRCRPSIPVWIMPIYRIAEQLRIAPNIFDVVIVDEASQAGVEATFLQYLAPKIVVIGDDRQVSPAGVGVDQQQLRDLANQYLYDDPYKPVFATPMTSLFDLAKMRFGGLTTLVEHRRCVPEIIGFSNSVVYEPDGIRLIPVRQFGADRLQPIKPVYVDGGYTRGGQNRINPVEADAIVDQIEKCTADPAYDGLTFGVISLLGGAQAKYIEKLLLDRLSPEEWLARELRCGDSADFQGSERNVMFLSMVAANDPEHRLQAQTKEMNLQRYNVAASRARDQMWLYHSVDLAELSHPEDLRRRLLDYCYGVVKRSSEVAPQFQNPVPEDVRVPPFDSLFEQRVFNRLVDRGYSVVPQHEVQGYRIDLVIVGSGTKVAIECDGDFWHGPDRYEADLARKRDLERCDWNFFNIRESLFYVDRAASLMPLWEMLDGLGVHPSGWVPVSPGHDNPPASGSNGSVEAGTEQAPTGTGDDTPTVPLADTSVLTEPLDGSNDLGPEVTSFSRESVVVRGDPALSHAPETTVSEVSRLGDPTTSSSRRSSFDRSVELVPYLTYTGRCVPTDTASQADLIDGLMAIVDVEGPVVGERLLQAYVQASGGSRVGRQIAHVLNSAVTTAQRRGLLVVDNPLTDQGVKHLTFRLETQPPYVPRELGPRTLDQVPPRELDAVLNSVVDRHGSDSEEMTFRIVLDQYGLRRLTTNVTELLQRAMRRVREQ